VRRKITRSSKEELDLQRKRLERIAERQRCRRQIDKVIKNNKNIINIAGIIHDNRITELNEENSLDVTLIHQQITCTGRIRSDRVIEGKMKK